jgi:5'-nucleotidase
MPAPQTERRFRPLMVLVTIIALLSLLVAPAALAKPAKPVPPPKPAKTVSVQLLAINDFHGNLQPIDVSSSSGRIGTTAAGGMEYLATHIKQLKETNKNTLVLSAGDLIGASPLLSALFHDEPTIEAMNKIGLDINAVGNHEFDEGVSELLRMQKGGCHPIDGCLTSSKFKGARFRFLAANVVYKSNGKPIFPAFKIKNFGGVKVAVIGLTLEGTPDIVTAGGIANVNFLDEAETINKLIPKIKKMGAETIVVLLHEGGAQSVGLNESTINSCTGISGPVVDIVNNTSKEVDLFITGHTHNAYNCVIDGRVVTSASSFGRLVTKFDMVLDKKSGEPVSIQANNLIVTRDVAKDPDQTALISFYDAYAAPLANRVIGSITANITRTNNTAGESALGDVIADGQLYDTAPVAKGGAVVAFMNPGGIRTDLSYTQISGGEQPGEVTYGEMFAVQPFGNNLVVMTLNGAQIETLLEQQFCNPSGNAMRILQVSEGFTYQWSLSAACGDKVDPTTIKINGVTVDPAAGYRITVNSFLADGGDGFAVLKLGTDRLGGAVDTDAFEAYFRAFSPVAPGPQNRIIRVP